MSSRSWIEGQSPRSRVEGIANNTFNPVIGAGNMRSKVEGSTDSIFHFMKWGQSLRSKVKDIDNCALPYIITEVIWCCRLHYTPTLRNLCEISCFGLNREVTLCEVPSNHFPLLRQAEMIRVTPHSEALPPHNTSAEFFSLFFSVIPQWSSQGKTWKKEVAWLKNEAPTPFGEGKFNLKMCSCFTMR